MSETLSVLISDSYRLSCQRRTRSKCNVDASAITGSCKYVAVYLVQLMITDQAYRYSGRPHASWANTEICPVKWSPVDSVTCKRNVCSPYSATTATAQAVPQSSNSEVILMHSKPLPMQSSLPLPPACDRRQASANPLNATVERGDVDFWLVVH